MNFSAQEDLDVSIDHVFAMMTDFDNIERAALRRGVEVQRLDNQDHVGVGMEWDVRFQFRGRVRELVLKLVDYDEPNGMRFEAAGGGIKGDMRVDLVAMSRSRTRMSVSMAMEATNLSARLILQSFKLARGKMNSAFHARVASYATDLENRFKQIS